MITCNSKPENKIAEKDDQDTVLTENVFANKSTANTQTRMPEENLSGEVIVLTEEEFIARITDVNNPKGFQYKGKTPCVIDFYADWCKPCHLLSPVLVALAKEYQSQVIFYKVNVEKARQVSKKLNIEFYPTLFLFKNGAQPVSIEGAVSQEELKKAIEEVLL